MTTVMRHWAAAIRRSPGNAVKPGHEAKKVTTPIPQKDQGCDVDKDCDFNKTEVIVKSRIVLTQLEFFSKAEVQSQEILRPHASEP